MGDGDGVRRGDGQRRIKWAVELCRQEAKQQVRAGVMQRAMDASSAVVLVRGVAATATGTSTS